MKTIEEELEACKQYAAGEGHKKNDPIYWAAAIGWFEGAMIEREKAYIQRIRSLEDGGGLEGEALLKQLEQNADLIEVAFLRRQAE